MVESSDYSDIHPLKQTWFQFSLRPRMSARSAVPHCTALHRPISRTSNDIDSGATCLASSCSFNTLKCKPIITSNQSYNLRIDFNNTAQPWQLVRSPSALDSALYSFLCLFGPQSYMTPLHAGLGIQTGGQIGLGGLISQVERLCTLLLARPVWLFRYIWGNEKDGAQSNWNISPIIRRTLSLERPSFGLDGSDLTAGVLLLALCALPWLALLPMCVLSIQVSHISSKGTINASIQLAASFGGLTWMFWDWRIEKKWSVIGFCSGAIAGLVAITPGAGYVGPPAAVLFGFMAGTVCNFATQLKFLFDYDDALDVSNIFIFLVSRMRKSGLKA